MVSIIDLSNSRSSKTCQNCTFKSTSYVKKQLFRTPPQKSKLHNPIDVRNHISRFPSMQPCHLSLIFIGELWLGEFLNSRFIFTKLYLLNQFRLVIDQTFGTTEHFGQTSIVQFGPNDRTFFCRPQNFFLYIEFLMISDKSKCNI